MKSGPAFTYWEQDRDFNFTQINSLQGSLDLGAIGHHWSVGALPLSLEDWEAHREFLARRDSFTDFVYARRAGQTTPQFVRVSGTPSFEQNGNFMGYRGFATDATALVEQSRTAWLAEQSLRSFDTPILWIEEVFGPTLSWRVIWSNVSGCALFGRTIEELRSVPPHCLFDHQGGGLQAISQVLNEHRSAEISAVALSKYGQPRRLRFRVDASAEMRRLSALPRRALLIATDAALEHRQSVLGVKDFGAGPSVSSGPSASSGSSVSSVSSVPSAEHPENAYIAELESFSFAVSHDLRAPLRLISGFAQILQEDYSHALDKIGIDHVQRILLAASRMGQMFDSLMDLSGLSAQRMNREPIDLSALAASIVDDLRIADPQRTVQIDIEPDLRVWGDKNLLRIALTNLLSNAWKYSARNPEAHITFGVAQNMNATSYCVADNGVGFDMRFVDRLFNPFQRLHSGGDFAGAGVGLATTKRVINRHGGNVWAESKVGQGSQFHFTLGERADRRQARQ